MGLFNLLRKEDCDLISNKVLFVLEEIYFAIFTDLFDHQFFVDQHSVDVTRLLVEEEAWAYALQILLAFINFNLLWWAF